MILGISPGTQTFGFVIIRNGELINRGTKSFRGTWTKKKLKWIVGSVQLLMQWYGITRIVVVLHEVNNRLPKERAIVDALRLVFEETYVSVAYMKHSELEELYGSRADLVHEVSKYYPILRRSASFNSIHIRRYHLNLFEAAAAAHLAQLKLNEEK